MGLGVAWLAIEKATHSDSDHDDKQADGPSMMDKAKGKLSGAAEVAKDWSDDASDSGHGLMGRGKDKVGEQARRRGSQVKNGFWSAMEEQPLVVGAVALGLGLASGLAAPASPWENKTMGRAADSLKKDVKGKVEDAAEAAGEVADKAKQTAKQRWQEETGGLKERAEQAGGRPEDRMPERRT
ncbi:MAG: hypothetical protein IH621_15535 [Krumholzibacteria bacterium]|nr:hypothetical protein [Candidatus Krumholzibacteria bacterium]